MAYITPQELMNASIDAGTLENFATGAAGQPNINRVGNDVKNLATIRVEALDSASAAAKATSCVARRGVRTSQSSTVRRWL